MGILNSLCQIEGFLFIHQWESISGDKIFVNIQEGFAFIYLVCFQNKAIFAKFLILLHTTNPFHSLEVTMKPPRMVTFQKQPPPYNSQFSVSP